MLRASLLILGYWSLADLVSAGQFRVAHATANHTQARGIATMPGPITAATSTKEAIAVDSFNCYKVEGDEKSGATPAEQGLADWNNGGPGGASWNAARLLCVASIRSTCTDGSVTTDLRVGQALLSSTTSPLSAGGFEWRVPLRRRQWERGLDEMAKPNRAPYRTALFRIAASLTCRAPYDLHPGIGPRHEFTAEAMFVAGFGRGE